MSLFSMFSSFREAFKSARSAPDTPDIEQPKRALPPKKNNVLFKHDLDEWEYIGSCEIRYTKELPGKIHCFAKKNNLNERSTKLVAPDHLMEAYNDHQTTLHWVPVRKSGLKPLHWLVNDEPSQFLRDYMLREYSYIWNNEKCAWITNESTKYQGAKAKQASQKETKEKFANEDNKIVAFHKKEV